MPRFLAVTCWLFAILLPASAVALGLGEIKLKSALNEPFVADIPMQLDDSTELHSVSISLATEATFERYGISFPAFLSDFRFFLSSDDSGYGTVQVRSVQPVAEPFITLLLEAEWPSGKLLREYTVLLESSMIPVQESEPLPQDLEPAVLEETNLSLAGSTYGPVQRGQTLWGLAEELRPDSSVAMSDMLLVLYRTNPSAFANNINQLKEGAILRIPDADEIGVVTRSLAESSVIPVQEPEPLPQDLEPAVSDEVFETQATDLLKSELAASLATELDSGLEESRELVEIKDPLTEGLVDGAAQEAAVTLTTEAGGVGDGEWMLDRAIELVKQFWMWGAGLLVAMLSLIGIRRRFGSGVVEEDQESIADDPLIGSWEDDDSDVDELKQDLHALVADGESFEVNQAVSAGAELGTGSDPAPQFSPDRGEMPGELGDASPASKPELDAFVETVPKPVDAIPAEFEMPVEGVGEVEDILGGALSMQASINLDQGDPVAEAEFYMANGLYNQAADLLVQALQVDPDNRGLRIKLLEVYFVWENKEVFLTEARILHEMIANDTDPDWNKVLIMGKQICPDDGLFSAVPVGTGNAGLMDVTFLSEDTDTAEVASVVEFDEPSKPNMNKILGLKDLSNEPTMTDVGTKLDLARAYIDMGDPDVARNTLKEVLEEGDDLQQQEARQLLDELID